MTDRRHFLAAAAAGAGLLAASSPAASEERGAEPAWLDVRDFGARLDGVNDDTAALQAAIDAAQERFVYLGDKKGRATIPGVLLPPGDCRVSATVYWKSCSLVGLDPGLSSRILWAGPDGGGPVLYKPAGYQGGGWVHRLEGISFESAAPAAQPRTWVMTDESIDKFSLWRRVRFKDCRGDAVVLTRGWINLHWEHLRWDNIGGYAIRALVHERQHLSSFALRGFTCDHNLRDSPSEGFLLIDNRVNQTNIGTLALADARIEINQPWRGKQALITYRLPLDPHQRTAGFFLSGINYQDGSGMESDCLLYLDAPAPGRESLILENCRMTLLASLLGGNWSEDAHRPEMPRGGAFSFAAFNSGDLLLSGEEMKLRGPAAERPYRAFSIARQDDAASRLAADYDGRLSWGAGAGEPDVHLFRAGAGVIKSDGRFLATGGLGVGNAEPARSPGRITGRVPLYDDKGNLLGYLPLYESID